MVKKLLKDFSRNAKRSAFWSAVVICLAVMTLIYLVCRIKSEN